MKKMPSWNNKSTAGARSVRKDAMLIGATCVAFIAIVFVPGLRLANSLVKNSTALKFVSEQRRYPQDIQSVLQSVQDRLNSRGFVQTPLDQLRRDEATLSAAIEQMSSQAKDGWFDAVTSTSALAQPALRRSVQPLRADWVAYRKALKPLVDFKGLPYKDSEVAGASLNEAGQALNAQIMAALSAARKMTR